MNLQLNSDVAENLPDTLELEEAGSWHAVRVRPRWEKLAANALHCKDYEAFLPLYRKHSQWSDRVKDIDVPLFPGYVFCRGEFFRRPRLVTTPGVIGILSFNGTPAVIDDHEIEAIKAVLRAGLYAEPWPHLREGQRVRVNSGALTGMEGILIRIKSDFRIVLSVEALCRSVAVEIHRECVTPLSGPAGI